MSRRGILRGGIFAFGAAVIGGSVVGCTSSSVPATPPDGPGAAPTAPKGAAVSATPAPRRGGTVNLSFNSQLSTLHPQMPNLSGLCVNRYVYDHLFYADYVNGKTELSLAQSLENPDPLTYVFKVKPTAKFQSIPPVNGRAVMSQDVVASWEAFVANPRTGNKRIFTEYVDHYETPDAATLIVRLKAPNAWVLCATALGAIAPAVVAPKELLSGDQLDKLAIGPGGYVLQQFDPTSTLSFVRRPDAWHTGDGRPYVDRVVYQVITDTTARAAAFKAKQIDALEARDKLEAEEFRSYGADVVIDRELGKLSQFFMRSDAPNGLFHDVRVREAVYCALDIQALIDTVELGEGQMSGPVPPELSAWAIPPEELKKQFPHDVRRAKELLTAAGWDATLAVDLKYPARQKDALLCEILQKQLGEAGIKTRLVPQDYNTVWFPQTWQLKDYQLTALTTFSQPKSADVALGNFQLTTHSRDAEFDALVAKEQVEFDFEKQRQIILEAERLLMKRFAPMILLYQPYDYSAHWKYCHLASRASDGDAGLFGHYSWTEKA